MPVTDFPACFTRLLKDLIKKFPRSEKSICKLLDSIRENPLQGDRIPGFASLHLRKTRIGLPEYKIGKSGGLRVIWFVYGSKIIPIYIVIYFKGEYRSEANVVALVKKNLKDILAEL